MEVDQDTKALVTSPDFCTERNLHHSPSLNLTNPPFGLADRTA